MSDDFQIYSDSTFRGGNPFADLERAPDFDLDRCFRRFDELFDLGEGNVSVGPARRSLTTPSCAGLFEVHRLLFPRRPAAGSIRDSAVAGVFRGQDCPEPQYVEQSLRNFEHWLSADSFLEIHPVEQTALTLTRLVDIWPFQFGNRTTAVVFANHFATRSGLPPFFVLPDQAEEFEQILGHAVLMQTEPLVRAIGRCMRRELELVRG